MRGVTYDIEVIRDSEAEPHIEADGERINGKVIPDRKGSGNCRVKVYIK